MRSLGIISTGRRGRFRGVTIVLILMGSFLSARSDAAAKRRVTVADAIEMVRLADPAYFLGNPSQGRVANFSPDGKQFLIALRRGNLQRNVNEFSLLLLPTSEALSHAPPNLLVEMSSSSNRDAIRYAKWLSDNQTIAFIGEDSGQVSQVYTCNTRTKRLEKLTNHPTGISRYDITPDGRELIFEADPPAKEIVVEEKGRQGSIVIADQQLPDILAGDSAKSLQSEIFFQKAGQPPVLVPTEDTIYPDSALYLSPTGKYALVAGHVAQVPEVWKQYEANPLHQFVASKTIKGAVTPLQRYLLIDTNAHSVTPLVNTPMLAPNAISWGANDQRVFLEGTYLPLDITDVVERDNRKQTTYAIEVMLPTKKYRKITKEELPKDTQPASAPEVTLQEDINNLPKISVFDRRTKQSVSLLNLNPQLERLDLGKVETIEWSANGITLIGGLYLPPDYVAGKRYPLVIQTHGFLPERFSMDGMAEWSSAFAARPLAANDIIVLQAYSFKDRGDHDRVGNDRTLGVTESQSFRNFNAIALEGALDHLEHEGIIDRNRVGIVGFSRTVCFVAYTLTHSNYRFAAISLVDGIDCGYFQYLAFPRLAFDFDDLNGGVSPFGDGLKRWIKESPGFNLDKVVSPVRLVALNPRSVLEMWEWYAGLTLQNKPVEMVEIPDGTHLLERPRDRWIAMEGMVDWFRFWLKGEEDPALEKRNEYFRWRQLRSH